MNNLLSRLQAVDLPEEEQTPLLSGRLTRVVGLTLEAVGIKVPLGQRCRIQTASGPMDAKVKYSCSFLVPTTSKVLPSLKI